MENIEQSVEQREEMQAEMSATRQGGSGKKKKGKKARWIALGVLAGVLCIAGVWYGVWGRDLFSPVQNNNVEIVAGEGQEIVYARIDAINGNEITYTITDMPVMNQVQEGDTETGRGNGKGQGGQKQEFGSGQMPEGMEMPDFEGSQMPDFGNGQKQGFDGGQMPEGMDEMPNFEGGGMPDFEAGEWQDFGGGEKPDGMEMPEGMERPEGVAEEDGKRPQRGERPQNEIASEQITAYIPVGTEVTTKLGTVTTFSRLAVGDYVALVVENDDTEQVIMAVYIVG